MRKCSIEGCNNEHRALGYCQMHYVRLKKYGDPNITQTIMNSTRSCSIEECDVKHYAKGLCKKHHIDKWRIDNEKHISEYNEKNKEHHKLANIDWKKRKRENEPEYFKERERKSNKRCMERYHNDPIYRQKQLDRIRIYREKNREHVNKLKRIWARNNPGSSRGRYGDDIELLLAMNNVRIRDDNSCQWYNCTETYKTTTIHVNHIFPQKEYPQYKYMENYMICYCVNHHAQWHKARGDYYWKLIESNKNN